MSNFDPIIQVTDDQLLIPEVNEWSLEKFKLVGSYCDIFTSGMKNKWGQLVYVDLFAGAGYCRIKETNRIYKNAALIAMSLPVKFSKYILCDANKECITSLEMRVKKEFPFHNVKFHYGDCNEIIESIKEDIPTSSHQNTVLTFCFIDPFSLNMKFTTIKSLAHLFIDFLILQAISMDGKRNLEKYLKLDHPRVSEYLGIANWRELFKEKVNSDPKKFTKFLADLYLEEMVKLKFKPEQLMHNIRTYENNMSLYHLSFFSKHPRGTEFFKKVQERVRGQLKIPF